MYTTFRIDCVESDDEAGGARSIDMMVLEPPVCAVVWLLPVLGCVCWVCGSSGDRAPLRRFSRLLDSRRAAVRPMVLPAAAAATVGGLLEPLAATAASRARGGGGGGGKADSKSGEAAAAAAAPSGASAGDGDGAAGSSGGGGSGLVELLGARSAGPEGDGDAGSCGGREQQGWMAHDGQCSLGTLPTAAIRSAGVSVTGSVVESERPRRTLAGRPHVLAYYPTCCLISASSLAASSAAGRRRGSASQHATTSRRRAGGQRSPGTSCRGGLWRWVVTAWAMATMWQPAQGRLREGGRSSGPARMLGLGKGEPRHHKRGVGYRGT